MNNRTTHRVLTALIASAWLINGLVCKVFDLVPRHELIVAQILGKEFSRLFTLVIGLAEVVMAVWILTGYKSRYNAIAQIAVVALMNILEYVLVPELLLWGRYNALFALLFVTIVYYNEFILRKKLNVLTDK